MSKEFMEESLEGKLLKVLFRNFPKMKYLLILFAVPGFLLAGYSTFAQERNILYDGQFGFAWTYYSGSEQSDTARIYFPVQNGLFLNRSETGDGDIKSGDRIVAINGVSFLNSKKDSSELPYLEAGPASRTFQFDIYRNSVDSLIRIPVTKSTDITGKFPLQHIDYFVDSSRNLTVKDLLRDPHQDLFVNDVELKDMIYAASYGAPCIWLRVNIESRLSKDMAYLLVFSASTSDSISAYFQNETGEWITQYAGMSYSEDLRGYVYKDWSAVQLNLSNRGNYTMYIRICSDNFSNFRYSYIQSLKYLQEKSRNERTIFSLLGGMMVMIMLFCILIYVITRARSYLLFFLFVASYIILAIAGTRYLGELDHTLPYSLTRNFYNLIYMLPVCFFLWFGMHQLETRRRYKQLHRAIIATLGLVIFSAFILTVADLLFNDGGYNRIFSLTSKTNEFTVNYLPYLVLAVPSLLRIRKRDNIGWYMLLASMFFIVLAMAEDFVFPGSPVKSLVFGLNTIDMRITLMNTVESVGIIVMFLIFAIRPYRS